MLQPEPFQSFDNILDTETSRSESSAAHWHNWAEKTSKPSVRDGSGTHSNNTPVTSPSHSTTTSTSTSTYTTANQLFTPDDTEQQPLGPFTIRNGNEYCFLKTDANLESIDVTSNIRSLFTDPPLCFCQKLASRSESIGFGVVYDCHFMSSDEKLGGPQLNSKYQKDTKTTHICGFHVHQQAWQKIGDLVKGKNVVNKANPELETCPYFNFTFCVAFCLSNPIKKSSPPAPRCFCNQPAILSEHDYEHKRRTCFVCRNFYINGAKPKCSWFMWADQVAFTKPNRTRHSPSLIDDAKSRIRPRRRTSTVLTDTTDSHYHHQQSDSLQTPQSTLSSSTLSQHYDLDLLTSLTNMNIAPSDRIKHETSTAIMDQNDDDKMSNNYDTSNNEQHFTYDYTTNTINSQKSEDLYQILQINKSKDSDSLVYHDTLLPAFTKWPPLSKQQQHRSNSQHQLHPLEDSWKLQALWDRIHHQTSMLIRLQEHGTEQHYQLNHIEEKHHNLEQEIRTLPTMIEKKPQ